MELDIKSQRVDGKPLQSKAAVAQIVTDFLQMQNQFKIFHWQTFSYSEHKAFDGIYDTLVGHVDKFLEMYMGKYGRPYAEGEFKLSLANYSDLSFLNFTNACIGYLVSILPSLLSSYADSDLLNVRDEILGDLNKLKYLLTLH